MLLDEEFAIIPAALQVIQDNCGPSALDHDEWYHRPVAVMEPLSADPHAVGLRLDQLKSWFPRADVSLMVARR